MSTCYWNYWRWCVFRRISWQWYFRRGFDGHTNKRDKIIHATRTFFFLLVSHNIFVEISNVSCYKSFMFSSYTIMVTQVVPLILSFLILSSLATPLIHLNILISATFNFSCAFFTAHVPYIIARLFPNSLPVHWFLSIQVLISIEPEESGIQLSFYWSSDPCLP